MPKWEYIVTKKAWTLKRGDYQSINISKRKGGLKFTVYDGSEENFCSCGEVLMIERVSEIMLDNREIEALYIIFRSYLDTGNLED